MHIPLRRPDMHRVRYETIEFWKRALAGEEIKCSHENCNRVMNFEILPLDRTLTLMDRYNRCYCSFECLELQEAIWKERYKGYD